MFVLQVALLTNLECKRMSRARKVKKGITSRRTAAGKSKTCRCTGRRAKGRSLVTKHGSDRIYTPDPLATDIVAHFRPCGSILEPAAGKGAFVRAMPGCDWCEIDLDKNFFDCQARYDWIVTNPPYSIFTDFLAKAVEVADNIVFLCPRNSWGMTSRVRILERAAFGMVESCRVPLPPPPWPQFGFVVTATWDRGARP